MWVVVNATNTKNTPAWHVFCVWGGCSGGKWVGGGGGIEW